MRSGCVSPFPGPLTERFVVFRSHEPFCLLFRLSDLALVLDYVHDEIIDKRAVPWLYQSLHLMCAECGDIVRLHSSPNTAARPSTHLASSNSSLLPQTINAPATAVWIDPWGMFALF